MLTWNLEYTECFLRKRNLWQATTEDESSKYVRQYPTVFFQTITSSTCSFLCDPLKHYLLYFKSTLKSSQFYGQCLWRWRPVSRCPWASQRRRCATAERTRPRSQGREERYPALSGWAGLDLRSWRSLICEAPPAGKKKKCFKEKRLFAKYVLIKFYYELLEKSYFS